MLRAWLGFAALSHVGAVALSYPALASSLTMPVAQGLFAALFPIMAVTAWVNATATDAEDDKIADLSQWVFGLGVSQFVVATMVHMDLQSGPANPLGAPASATPAMRAAWFAGFSVIATFGNTFFIGRPLLGLLRPMQRRLRALRSGVGIGLVVATAVGLGATGAVLLASPAAAETAIAFNATAQNDPVSVLLGVVVVPVVLHLLHRVMRRRKSQ